jgi:uncharacterized membrane protein
MKNNIIALLTTLALISGCTKDKTPIPVSQENNCDPNHIYFQNDVLPILNSNCAKSGCHDAITHEEGINYSTHAGAYGTIKPGDLGDSELYESITSTDPDDMMPPPGNTQLTDEQLDILAQWIIQGGLNDECTEGDSSSCTTANMSFANDIAPIISTNCNGCHSGSSPSGGINLSNYSGVAAIAASGKLYNSVAQNGMAQAMPQTSKLSDCNINKIKSWVDAGYPNN